MTTVLASANAAITNDATYRAWGVVVSAAFASAGLVQTSDTGQVNWTTVTKPTAASTLAGYEIWRFNDTLQSTAPIFIRISYYSGAQSSGNNPVLRITVGTGSNGAGTITGVNTGLLAVGNTADTNAGSNTAQILRMCFSASAGTFVAFSDPYTGAVFNHSFQFLVARTVDSAGAPSAAGCYVWYGPGQLSSASAAQCVSINFTSATAFGPGNPNAAPPGDLTNYDSGSTMYVLPHYACLPAPVLVAGLVGLRTMNGGFTFTATVAGSVSHTYQCVGYDATSGNAHFLGGTLLGNAGLASTTNETAWNGAIGVIWE